MPPALIALALTMLLPSLGTSIVNVALPSLETAFGAPFSDVQWVVLSYLLAVTTLIVGAGRLGDLVGRRALLLGGIGLFTLASAAAAFAPNLGVLIGARTVQGMGAAIMMSLSVAQISEIVPAERTGSAIGLLATVSAIGTALGPSVGGALLSLAGWPAVFGIMAVIGATVLAVGARLLPLAPSVSPTKTAFDLAGMVLLALSLGVGALSATLGGPHPDLVNAGLAALAGIGIVAFVAVERRTGAPLLRIDLLLRRDLRSGLVSLGLVSSILMATLVVGPFYLSQGLGLAPAQAGLVMSIGPAVAAVAGVPAGRLVDAFGSARGGAIGLLGIIAGALMMTLLPSWFGAVGYGGSLAAITAGYALFQAANNTAIMAGAGSDERGVTSGLLGLARNLGLITGASLMGTVFSIGQHGLETLGLPAGSGLGLQLSFTVAALLAATALALTVRATRPVTAQRH